MPCWKNICTIVLVCGWLLYREWFSTYEVILLQLSPQTIPFPTSAHTYLLQFNHIGLTIWNTVLRKHIQISSHSRPLKLKRAARISCFKMSKVNICTVSLLCLNAGPRSCRYKGMAMVWKNQINFFVLQSSVWSISHLMPELLRL